MYLPQASVTEILAAASKLNPSADEALMILVAEQNAPDLDVLRRALAEKGVRFFGGIFPAVIAGARTHLEGAIMTALPVLAPPRVFPNLDHEDLVVPDLEIPADDSLTVILLVDGLGAGIPEFLAGVFGQLGPAAHYLGGGAGTPMTQRPCIFTAEGVFQNAAVLAFVPWRGSLGVQHGLKRLDGPIVVTAAHHNVVKEMNWRPAFEVYRAIVERDAGHPLTPENFYREGRAWAYPFGLVREGVEDVVREPLLVTVDGGIQCGGGVPENTVLHVMKGQSQDLIAAARKAAETAARGAQGRPRYALVCDCISRQFFLGQHMADELEAVAREVRKTDAGLEPEGMLTLGEISSSGESVLDFFNKTIVVGILSDG
ncbi:MAG: FIST C-terminal domain-containing protein [Verrucomicrobia bacterium]|nr:FIST C-terminal domain-containing protein [Verrucomicrobiota bacterium]